MVQFHFCHSHWVCWAEVGMEFFGEFSPAVFPKWDSLGVIFQYSLLKPFQCCLLQVADGKKYFGLFGGEVLGGRVEHDLTLQEESPQVLQVCSIEHVWGPGMHLVGCQCWCLNWGCSWHGVGV